MANPFQKRAWQRKIAYLVAIFVLFFGSILFRKLVILPKALSLQLHEQAHGEVELAGAAVRQLLSGSRGWATTILWSAAIEKQKKHEWNEVELLVGSITKLQPYFLTPWMFQSWNLAFNVSVECDRTKDKYYYITRGIELLAEGERRNQGTGELPGHPELRHTMATYYLYKIGLSDEATTMKCLFDLSTIDPLQRNPDWFYTIDPQTRRKVINTKELLTFCTKYPRLVRRLREGLNYPTEGEIVKFLKDNQDVPNRFVPVDWVRLPTQAPEQRQTKLKEVRDQFPIFPPPFKPGMPNPADYDITNETLDPYLLARSWSEYAQAPLPPPMFGDRDKEEAKRNRKYRLPKAMALILFRGWPARTQAYIAEKLEEEGWFDSDGWVITKWFDKEDETGVRVGTERKYHAQPAWERAANLYYEYGRANDLFYTPDVIAELTRIAEPYRRKYQIRPGERGPLRSDDQNSEVGKGWEAHHRLIWSLQNRGMTNFDNNYSNADAQRSPEAVHALKLFFQADRLRRQGEAPETALARYEEAWPFWIDVLLQHPAFARNQIAQEDMYDIFMKQLRLEQTQRASLLRPIAMGFAQMAVQYNPPFEVLLSPSERARILPIRNARGVLDWIQVVDVPDAGVLPARFFVATWPRATLGFPAVLAPPTIWSRELTRMVNRSVRPPAGWRYLIDEASILTVRDRLGVTKR
jgi:hypothetical protein